MELHILITQGSFNTAHETDLCAFNAHFPSLERQSRLSDWNYGARSGTVRLRFLRLTLHFYPQGHTLEKGHCIQKSL